MQNWISYNSGRVLCKDPYFSDTHVIYPCSLIIMFKQMFLSKYLFMPTVNYNKNFDILLVVSVLIKTANIQ